MKTFKIINSEESTDFKYIIMHTPATVWKKAKFIQYDAIKEEYNLDQSILSKFHWKYRASWYCDFTLCFRSENDAQKFIDEILIPQEIIKILSY